MERLTRTERYRGREWRKSDTDRGINKMSIEGEVIELSEEHGKQQLRGNVGRVDEWNLHLSESSGTDTRLLLLRPTTLTSHARVYRTWAEVLYAERKGGYIDYHREWEWIWHIDGNGSTEDRVSTIRVISERSMKVRAASDDDGSEGDEAVIDDEYDGNHLCAHTHAHTLSRRSRCRRRRIEELAECCRTCDPARCLWRWPYTAEISLQSRKYRRASLQSADLVTSYLDTYFEGFELDLAIFNSMRAEVRAIESQLLVSGSLDQWQIEIPSDT